MQGPRAKGQDMPVVGEQVWQAIDQQDGYRRGRRKVIQDLVVDLDAP
jgi:hypothetical protein